MKKTAAVCVCALLGCGSRPLPVDDAAGRRDGSTVWRDGRTGRDGPPPVVFDLGVPPRDFVASRIFLPSSATVHKLGVDYNGDGNVDNALGSILGALSGISGSLDLQQTLDSAVASGIALMLLRLQATDYVDTPAALGWSWVGKTQPCSSQSCFDGSHTFPAVSDTKSPFTGRITAGKLHLGPSRLRFRFPIGAGNVLDLTLKQAFIDGRLAQPGVDKIEDGVLAGAIDQSDMKTQIVPALAQLLNELLADPATAKQTHDTIIVLFDADKDGKISMLEVAQNSIIKTFLSGDVDVDGDGVNEISLGLGFKAVSARIQP